MKDNIHPLEGIWNNTVIRKCYKGVEKERLKDPESRRIADDRTTREGDRVTKSEIKRRKISRRRGNYLYKRPPVYPWGRAFYDLHKRQQYKRLTKSHR